MLLRAVLLIALSLLASAATAQAGTLQNPAMSQGVDVKTIEILLSRGPILMIQADDAGKLELTTGGVLINAPIERVWDVIIDFARYPEFMPGTESAEVLRRDGNVVDTRFRVGYQVSVLKYSVDFTTRNMLKPFCSMTWQLVEGDMDSAYGCWDLIPLDGGRTAAFYSIYSDLRSIHPIAKAVLDADPSFEIAANASTVILLLQALKIRVENPQKQSPNLKAPGGDGVKLPF